MNASTSGSTTARFDRWADLLPVLALLLLAAGCTPADDAPTESETDRSAPALESSSMKDDDDHDPLDGSDPAPPPRTIDEAVDAARTHLAGALGIDRDSIAVTGRRAVTWRNGALGCPEPGMMYTQALVPGFWIRLEVDGEIVHYHAARGQAPFRCPADRAETPLPPDDDPAV